MSIHKINKTYTDNTRLIQQTSRHPPRKHVYTQKDNTKLTQQVDTLGTNHIYTRKKQDLHNKQAASPRGITFIHTTRTILTQQKSRHPSGKTNIYTQLKHHLHYTQVDTPQGQHMYAHSLTMNYTTSK